MYRIYQAYLPLFWLSRITRPSQWCQLLLKTSYLLLQGTHLMMHGPQSCVPGFQSSGKPSDSSIRFEETIFCRGKITLLYVWGRVGTYHYMACFYAMERSDYLQYSYLIATFLLFAKNRGAWFDPTKAVPMSIELLRAILLFILLRFFLLLFLNAS